MKYEELAELTVSGPVLAKVLDVTPRWVQKLAKDGVIAKARRGEYPLVEATQSYVRWREASVRADSLGRDSDDCDPGGDNVLDLNAERARLAAEQADGHELKNAQLRGELVPRADLETTLIALAAGTSQRLRGVPTATAPAAHAAGTIAEAEEVIRDAIDGALSDLAEAGDRLSA